MTTQSISIPDFMEAISVKPGTPNDVILDKEFPVPTLDQVPDGMGLLCRVLQVGVDGTDAEIIEGLYGEAPSGERRLIIGHEASLQVIKVGDNVTNFAPGDIVAPMVRLPQNIESCMMERIGRQCQTTLGSYCEHAISKKHGHLAEYSVVDSRWVIKAPLTIPVFMIEPTSIVLNAARVVSEIRHGSSIIKQPGTPLRVLVTGAGQIGLFATAYYRLRNAEVVTVARRPGPHLKQQLVEEMGATYVSTQGTTLLEALESYGRFDVIIEASGNSGVAVDSCYLLANNGINIWTSITGGDSQHTVNASKLVLDFVLNNKTIRGVVNHTKEDFRKALALLLEIIGLYPGWIDKILTHRYDGLEAAMDEQNGFVHHLANPSADYIKGYVNVAKQQ